MSTQPPLVHDLTCVIHVHSTYSDGTGTVPEIVRAARRAGVDVVLLTDHNTLRARDEGHEGWHDDVLLLVGEEVTPARQNHFLAFGIDEPAPWREVACGDICRSVADAGGFGFAAHPFSRGNERFHVRPMPWRDLDCDGLAGIELWSFVNDAGASVESLRDAWRLVRRPAEALADGPPAENLREWDRLNASGRRVVGIGGLDAHQVGRRVLDRWVVRPMGYARSFRTLRTHVLCEELPTGELEHDREQVYAALRDGRCYIANDALAPATGFRAWVDGGGEVQVRTPRPAEVEVKAAGDARRVEVRLDGRVWILSNFLTGPGITRSNPRPDPHLTRRP